MTQHAFNGAAKEAAYLTWAVLGYSHPDDVLGDPALSTADKRMILASWLSDRRSVENKPSLRQLDNGAILPIDEIRDALIRLDGQAEGTSRFA